MASRSFLERADVTPGKMILIAVLAVILVSVIVMQMGGDAEAVKPTRASRPSARGEKALTSSASQKDATARAAMASSAPAKRWPEVSRAKVVKHDPFARPSWSIVLTEPRKKADDDGKAAARVAADRARALRELQEKGVGAVVLGHSGKMAVIGSATVQIGDTIEGFLVKDITTDGVVLVEHDAH